MPEEFIAGSGTHVTEAFHRYLEPLLGTAMPQVHRLRGVAVPKRLTTRV
jgi:6-phosphofructokinase 1